MSSWLLKASVFFSPLFHLGYGGQAESVKIHSRRMAKMREKSMGNLRGNIKKTNLGVFRKKLSGWDIDELDRIHYG